MLSSVSHGTLALVNASGLQQAEMAARLGVSRRSITRLESDLARPKPAILIAWAHVTNVHLEWLDGDEGIIVSTTWYRHRWWRLLKVV